VAARDLLHEKRLIKVGESPCTRLRALVRCTEIGTPVEMGGALCSATHSSLSFLRLPPRGLQFARFLLRLSFGHNEGRVDGRQIRVTPSGNIRDNRCFVRSDICSLPTQQASDFASVDTQIAEHVVIHFGELGHGAADRQFGFDRPLHFRQVPNDSRDKEPPDQT
jgi:hypothetical protein